MRVYKLKNGWVIQYSDGTKKLVYKDYTLKDIAEILIGRFIRALEAVDFQLECREYIGRWCSEEDYIKYVFEKYFGIEVGE